jgi:hypothetical protein
MPSPTGSNKFNFAGSKCNSIVAFNSSTGKIGIKIGVMQHGETIRFGFSQFKNIDLFIKIWHQKLNAFLYGKESVEAKKN